MRRARLRRPAQRSGRIQPETLGNDAGPAPPGSNCSEMRSKAITRRGCAVSMNSH